eukprot:GEMP01025706.1.p1 GENE.GEMP01025706.1~~GEMP01025706.1.p1  ORF type:complete len:145 (+),score=25.14 GEMP01025706.1:205-639(+)
MKRSRGDEDREILRLPPHTMLYSRQPSRCTNDAWPADVHLSQHVAYLFGDNAAEFFLDERLVPPPCDSKDIRTTIWQFKLFAREGLRLISRGSQEMTMDVDGFVEGQRVVLFRPGYAGIQVVDDNKIPGMRQTFLTDMLPGLMR